MRLIPAIALGALILGSSADAFDHADRASLDAALQRYAADLEAQRLTEVDRAIPPRVYAIFTDQSGETEAVMRKKMIDLEERLLGGAEILDVRFDVSGMQILDGPGTLDYAFVDTHVTTRPTAGPDITTHQTTFALQENGVWYFLRLRRRSDFSIIQTAYPGFAGVEPPR